MALQAIKQFRTRELTSFLKANPKVTQAPPKIPNPFLPRLNPESGRWAPAKYSLRRQAELVKKARETNTLHLLPAGPKFSPEELRKATQSASEAAQAAEDSWSRNIVWEGEVKEKKVPGADIGNRLYAGKKRMFKGHKWERTREKRETRFKLLMRDMGARIKRFKNVYRRKRPSPLSRPRVTTKPGKLPF